MMPGSKGFQFGIPKEDFITEEEQLGDSPPTNEPVGILLCDGLKFAKGGKYGKVIFSFAVLTMLISYGQNSLINPVISQTSAMGVFSSSVSFGLLEPY